MPTFDFSPSIFTVGLPIFLLLLLVILGSWASRRGKGQRGLVEYDKQKLFLTESERAFFGVLCSVANPWFYVAPKVRLFDLVVPRKGLSRSLSRTARNLIVTRHCDFVLCQPDTMQPAVVIELDDCSHDEPKRQIKDRELEWALRSAGLPLLRVRRSNSYSPQELTEKIRLTLQG